MTLHSNRSAAHAGVGDYAAALADAQEAVRLNPKWPKAWSRKGFALYQLRRCAAHSLLSLLPLPTARLGEPE